MVFEFFGSNLQNLANDFVLDNTLNYFRLRSLIFSSLGIYFVEFNFIGA